MSFAFMEGGREPEEERQLPEMIEYAWDFEKDCFIKKDGRQVIVTGDEALKVWIYKTLKTERYRYLAYTKNYGAELEQFIGKRPNNEEAAMEVERYVTEALIVNPRITEISNVSFTNEKDILHMEVTVKTVYGKEVKINV